MAITQHSHQGVDNRVPRVAILATGAAAAWAILWALNGINVGYGSHEINEVRVGSSWDVNWFPVVLAATCAIAAIAALVLIRRGDFRKANWALLLTAVAGF